MYSQNNLNYKRISWMGLEIDGFDLREINRLENTYRFTEADILYNRIILENIDNDFFFFLFNERRFLRKSNNRFSFVNELDCFNKVKDLILENGDLSEILPPTIIIGLMGTCAYGLVNKNLFVNNFKIVENKTFVGDFTKVKNGAYI